MGARAKIPPPLDSLMRSQLETAIHESALHRDDDLIARRCIIDKWAQIDIAAELGWYRGAVASHEKYILPRVAEVAKKLYTNQA